MIGQIIFLLYIILLYFVAKVLLRQSFEFSLPLSFLGTILILFLFGILRHLRFGVYCLLLLSAVLFFCSLVTAVLRKELKASLKSFLSPGFLFFLSSMRD